MKKLWAVPLVCVAAALGYYEMRVPAVQREGEEAIRKIDAFKESHGALPASLADVGVAESEDGPLHYLRTDDQGYLLWYGTSSGKSVIYDSHQKTWHE